MAGEIERAGGTVEKFAGDSVMAVFGVPEALEDHAERALHAALAMQARLQAVFEGRLELRIGVNTGEVVAGPARQGSSFVSGDAVNVAARLEQAAEPGAIVVGARTAEAVRGAFELGSAFEVDAKGKAEPVVAQTLVARADADAAARASRRRPSVRRPRHRARAAAGDLPPCGRAARAPRRHARSATRASGRRRSCGSSGGGSRIRRRSPFSAPAGAWRTATSPTGRSARFFESTWESSRRESQEEVRRRLGDREILGLALGLDLTGDAHPLAVRDRFQEAWVEFLSELTAETPTVVLVEDLHWAEDPLLDLLERVCARRSRPAARDRHRPSGAARPPPFLGWRPPQRIARLARRPFAGRVRRDARRARARRALDRDAARARRAGGGESLLPRGAAGRLRRDRHGRGGAAGLGSGDPLGARRPARERRQGGASGGIGHRPGLLERPDAGARRR